MRPLLVIRSGADCDWGLRRHGVLRSLGGPAGLFSAAEARRGLFSGRGLWDVVDPLNHRLVALMTDPAGWLDEALILSSFELRLFEERFCPG